VARPETDVKRDAFSLRALNIRVGFSRFFSDSERLAAWLEMAILEGGTLEIQFHFFRNSFLDFDASGHKKRIWTPSVN
jgi:hypothetical protein